MTREAEGRWLQGWMKNQCPIWKVPFWMTYCRQGEVGNVIENSPLAELQIVGASEKKEDME